MRHVASVLLYGARDPDVIGLEAAIRLEELPDRPRVAWHFTDLADADSRRPCAGPVQNLSYDVLIHLDQVIDYRPPSAASTD
jgi:hypothetical protein